MLTQNEFELWCERLKFSPETRVLVAGIRAADLSRRVKSAADNVSGRYPSRKMGCTIQFESHRNELAAILEFEHSHTILCNLPKLVRCLVALGEVYFPSARGAGGFWGE